MTENRLRIGFMGTPDFSVPALEHLIDSEHEVVCVYTQPPRPKGRGHKVLPTPIDHVASTHAIPVHTPTRLKKNPEEQKTFDAYDLDVAIVAAYGLILPREILQAPRHGCLNIHASLLPRWRGASPIQHAIWKGDEQSGITIMQMDEGLDTGAMIEKKAVPIRAQTTAQSLHDELSALGAVMTLDVVKRLAAEGKLEAEKQDESISTYAPLLTKEDGKVNWTQSAEEIDCQIRALNPWPGVYTQTPDGKRIKIKEAELVSEAFTEPPGTLIDSAGHVVCGGDSAIRLLKIQPDNAKPMDVVSAINGGYLTRDTVFAA